MPSEKQPSEPSLLDLRFVLREEHFRALCRGGTVVIKGADPRFNIQLALADIGFDIMDKALSSAESGIDRYKPYVEVVDDYPLPRKPGSKV